MSDRIKGFIVTLDDSYRQEDAKRIADAVRMIKGVLVVTESVDDHNDVMNRMRIKHEVHTELFAVIHPKMRRAKEKRDE